MAVYLDLGIDCGTSSEVADAIQAHFDGFTFPIPGVADVECEALGRWHRLEHWILSVWPRGLALVKRVQRMGIVEISMNLTKEVHDYLRSIDKVQGDRSKVEPPSTRV